jgi:2-oxoglutarate ferredoxin oxidoreductase subunit beta
MAATATSQPQPKTNHIGLTVLDYRGSKTTLCAGCGHNAISERIIDAFYEMGMPQLGTRAHAVGHDWCGTREPSTGCTWCQRRR